VGKYVYSNFIRGIADECGHAYEHLFEATQDMKEEPSLASEIEREFGLCIACEGVAAAKAQGKDDDVASGEESDEDDQSEEFL
jgi:hypothetical protein